jgi:aryl-alcohol dehydrogenase-like predicted oxidoreductase
MGRLVDEGKVGAVGVSNFDVALTGAIVGARSVKQVDGWVAAGSIELDTSDLEQIAAVIGQTSAGSGRTSPSQVRNAAIA